MLQEYSTEWGGKAAGLARLRRLGMLVPEGRVIPATRLAGLAGAPARRIEESPVFPPLLEYAAGFWSAGKRVILRSSAAVEDSEIASFAGQFESSGPLANRDEMLAGLTTVLRGFASQHLETYRRRVGAEGGLENVILQEFIAADYSGVAFGCHPVTGDADVISISVVEGFSGALLSGEQSGYSLVADKRSGRLVVGHLPGELLQMERWLPVLAELLRSLEEADPRWFPDVEFAISENRLYCLQWRPETTVTRIPSDAAAGHYYGRELLGEWLSDRVSRLFETLFFPALFPMLESECRRVLGFRLEQPCYLIHDGFFYLRLRLNCSVLAAVARLPFFARRGLDYWTATVRPAIRVIDGYDPAEAPASEAAAVEEVNELLRANLAIVCAALLTAPPAVGLEMLLRGLFRLLAVTHSPLDYLGLMRSGQSKSLAARQALTRIGAELQDPVARKELGPWLRGEARARIPEHALTPSMHDFLKTYGHLSEVFDLSAASLREQGYWLANAARLAARPAGDDRAGNTAPSPAVRLRPLARPFAWLVRPLLRRLAAAASSYQTIRDDRAFYSQYGWDRIRSRLLWLGGRLVERGLLAAPEEIFDLSWTAIRETLEAEPIDGEPLERRRHDRHRAIPQLSINTPAILRRLSRRLLNGRQVITGEELRGSAASPGVASGRVAVADSLADLGRVTQGDILVCQLTTPAWTAVFGLLAGVVTETGNPLSHAAIVAREYGIPCVVGVAGARQNLRSVARVTVDGSRGTVVSSRVRGD